LDIGGNCQIEVEQNGSRRWLILFRFCVLEVVKHKEIHHSLLLFIVFQDEKTGSIVIHIKDSDKHAGF